MFTHHAFRVAIIISAAGVLSRSVFRYFETRWQIAIFAGAALAYQLVVRPALGLRVSAGSTLLDLACVTVAIVATKVAVEGHL